MSTTRLSSSSNSASAKDLKSHLQFMLGDDAPAAFIEGLQTFLPENFFADNDLGKRLSVLEGLRKEQNFYALLQHYKHYAKIFLTKSVNENAALIQKLKSNRLGQYFIMSLEERCVLVTSEDYMNGVSFYLSANFFHLSARERCAELVALRHNLSINTYDHATVQRFILECLDHNQELYDQVIKELYRPRSVMLLMETAANFFSDARRAHSRFQADERKSYGYNHR